MGIGFSLLNETTPRPPARDLELGDDDASSPSAFDDASASDDEPPMLTRRTPATSVIDNFLDWDVAVKPTKPVLKLERLTVGQVVAIFLTMNLSAVFSIASLVAICATTSERALALDLAFRCVSGFINAFLLATFPQRVLRSTSALLPEQAVVALIVVLFNLAWQLNAASAVLFAFQFSAYDGESNFFEPYVTETMRVGARISSAVFVAGLVALLGVMQRLFGDPKIVFDKSVAAWCFAYAAIVVALLSLGVNVSLVPFVSIITMLRACLNDSCASSVLKFRAAFLTVKFIFEILLFKKLLRINRESKRALSAANNSSYKRIEYRFFTNNRALVYSVLLVQGVLVCSISDLEYWGDELTRVGVFYGAPGFGAVAYVATIWLLVVAYVHLPPNSYGLVGFFCGDPKRFSERRIDTRDDYRHPRLIVKESHCEPFVDDSTSSFSPRVGRDFSPGVRHDYPLSFESDSFLIEKQIKSNVFVVETEILCWNFSLMAYPVFFLQKKGIDVCEFYRRQSRGMISNIKLCAHEKKHVLGVVCAYGLDRVVVSFRGTQGVKNLRADLNYVRALYEPMLDVEPFVDNNSSSYTTESSKMRPLVHRGFLGLWKRISNQVLAAVDDVLRTSKTRRAVTVCGHSLGGALGTFAAFEIAKKHPRVAVQLTTFGSPKVGSFSFTSRHRRLVPTTHRFVVPSDLVPKMPPATYVLGGMRNGFVHVGKTVLLDNRGHLLISPSVIEHLTFHSLKAPSLPKHMPGSYSLSMIMWSERIRASLDDGLPFLKSPFWDFVARHAIDKYTSDGLFSSFAEIFGADYDDDFCAEFALVPTMEELERGRVHGLVINT